MRHKAQILVLGCLLSILAISFVFLASEAIMTPSTSHAQGEPTENPYQVFCTFADNEIRTILAILDGHGGKGIGYANQATKLLSCDTAL